MSKVQLRPGRPFPLGSHWDGSGVNFALASRHATRVDLCLFRSPDDQRESYLIPLASRTDDVWHAYVEGLSPGQVYGYRVHGPFQPQEGHRFNGNKVLLDPYAQAIARNVRWHDAVFGYTIGSPEADLSCDGADSAPYAPLAAVIDPRFQWGSDRPPRIPWERTVIYEAHVRGATMLHPDVPAGDRGTFLGLASRPMLRHFQQLGVTTIELLPVQFSLDDRFLIDRGLKNYWGYSSLGYFAPHPRYASSCHPQAAVNEFRQMVKQLHAAGLEVLIDVVYNHTGEGNRLGPTLSLRGVDNALYYRLDRRDKRLYTDYSGCGNCLEYRQPHVLRLIADSLRYWVTEMHVDGFRFDLAPVMGRDHHAFNRLSAFFQIVQQDPVLSQVKLIAEPWDLGDNGYQLGGFPAPWREWNGRYRDTIRDFWRGESMSKGEFATRLCGSQDLFPRPRRALASINYVACHDGFSLHDLCSYNQKHNDANGEENRDGDDHNHSWNCGIEGPTDDAAVNALRQRQMRNLLMTLLLSQGVPMLRSGDEMAQSQSGNNNTYCQDNELSWLPWPANEVALGQLKFLRRVMQLRSHLIRQSLFIRYVWDLSSPQADVKWIRRDGQPMADSDWHDGKAQVGVLLCQRRLANDRPAAQTQAHAQDVLLIFNAHHEPLAMDLPSLPRRTHWRYMVDTFHPQLRPQRVSSLPFITEARSAAALMAARSWFN